VGALQPLTTVSPAPEISNDLFLGDFPCSQGFQQMRCCLLEGCLFCFRALASCRNLTADGITVARDCQRLLGLRQMAGELLTELSNLNLYRPHLPWGAYPRRSTSSKL